MSIEARAQWILSTIGLRTSDVDAMLEEVEQALTTADAKLAERFLGSNHIKPPLRACRTKCG
jgi:hypothetical protein